MTKEVYGYKVFNEDWTCRDFQYEVGKTYTHEGNIELCGYGFHFCPEVSNCFNYYSFNPKNKIAEVIAHGQVLGNKNKLVTDVIEIVREVSWEEMLALTNQGKGNTGLNNTGNYNSGNYNSGYHNLGYRNTGNWNSGGWNSGDLNSGFHNSGFKNSGNQNTGNYNSGNRNSGDWNISNHNSGCFNTENHKMRFFDKESDLTYEQWIKHKGRDILTIFNYYRTLWIPEEEMTDEEKENNLHYKITKGYFRRNPKTRKEAFQDYWNELTKEDKEAVFSIPNFDAKKFKLITGVDTTDEIGIL